MSGGGDAQLRQSQRCTTGSQECLLCLFSPHCSQISVVSFSRSSLWFLSAPYQEPDLNKWFLHLLISSSHQGFLSKGFLSKGFLLSDKRPSLQRCMSIMQPMQIQTFTKKCVKICPKCLHLSTESENVNLQSELGCTILNYGGNWSTQKESILAKVRQHLEPNPLFEPSLVIVHELMHWFY